MNYSKSIFLLPDALSVPGQVEVVRFRNPSTNRATYFIFKKSTKEIYEIQSFDECFRSWIIDENVISDGSIKLTTPYNPLYLILPYLMKAEKIIPLEHQLEDKEFPDTVLLCDIVENLSNVADQKGPTDLGIWVYNEKSCLEWLSRKVESLATVLQFQKERTSLTNTLNMDYESYYLLAFNILSENINDDLKNKLKNHLNLVQMDKENSSTDLNESNAKSIESSRNPKEFEDKLVLKQSTKAKKLATSAKGSKAITSFFKKLN